MTTLRITGFAALSSAGAQPGALAQRVAAAANGQHDARVPVSELYAEPLPADSGHALVDFDVRAYLGRKGTSFYDRATALAVVGCGEALRDAGIEVDDETRARTGLVLGTTLGSFKSTSDYSRDTLIQEKPYLVNPVLFPNTVMNCAAGQAAIRHGLRGINATITGGPLAFLNSVRYASNAINQGYADMMLVGAVEEFTPHRAWMISLRSDAQVAAGEAVAVFALGRAPDSAGGALPSTADAEILAVATGYGPAGTGDNALDGCIRRALRHACVDAGAIALLVTGDSPGARGECGPAARVLGREPERLEMIATFGDCGAANGALALATVLELHRADPGRDGQLTLLTARGADGAVAAAIVRGWSRAGADRS
jgi:3-oxoacyl-[acyl-carrier-protein] synthase II